MKKKSKKVAKAPEAEFPIEMMALGDLKPHPKNYRSHPDDQLAHIGESLRQNAFYKNVVIARDGTILAGHGVVEAARKAGVAKVPVRRLDVDPGSTRAMKILAGDNELPRFSENDDRALSEMLQRIMKEDENGLLGTGYDEHNLAAFLMVTRPASEIRDLNEAAEWVGMPEYDQGGEKIQAIITFDGAENRTKFFDEVKFSNVKKNRALSWSANWPEYEKEDVSSLKFKSKAKK